MEENEIVFGSVNVVRKEWSIIWSKKKKSQSFIKISLVWDNKTSFNLCNVFLFWMPYFVFWFLKSVFIFNGCLTDDYMKAI